MPPTLPKPRLFAVGVCLLGLLTVPAFGQALSAPGLSFGNVAVGETSTTRAISFKNTLLVPVTLVSVTVSGGQAADFASGSACVLPAVVAPGRTCAVGVRFTPGALGVRTSTLVFAHDQPGSPLTAPMTGTGVPPVSLAPSPLSLGNVVLGTAGVAKAAVLTNASTAPLSIASITVAAPFSRQGGTCPAGAGVLAGRTSCTILLVFSPTVAGLTSGSLTVVHGATNSPSSATLSGNGVPPVTTSPTSLTFPSRTVGTTSPPAKVGIVNRSGGVLALGAITASGDFAVSSTTCGASLAAGAQCALGVMFAPTATGTRSGVLSIPHGAFGSPLQVPLAGTGNVTGLLSIAVTPANSTMRLWEYQQMTATGTFVDGHAAVLTTSVAWSAKGSPTPIVVGVYNTAGMKGVIQAVNIGTADVTATLGAIAGSTGVTVIANAPVTLSVTPSTVTLGLGISQQFTATATYSDGTSADVTSTAFWDGGFPWRGHITTDGLYKQLATGSNPVSASLGGKFAPASAIGVMPVRQRAAGTATPLLNGRVLIAGGIDDAVGTSAIPELFDSATGTFVQLPPLLGPRFDHTATRLADGRVLIAGGTNGPGPASPSAEIFDPSTNSWSAAGAMKTARRDHAAVLVGNKVLVIGGWNGGFMASAELFDPATNTWEWTGSLSTGRSDHSATLLPDGRVLVAGGRNSAAALASSEIYNPATGLWSPSGNLTTAREHHTATLLATNEVLAVGGSNETGQRFASAEIFDVLSGAWFPTGSLPESALRHTATLMPSGRVLIAGGVGDSDTYVSTAVYNPATGTFEPGPQLAYSRQNATAALLDTGAVLISGGMSPTPGNTAEVRPDGTVMTFLSVRPFSETAAVGETKTFTASATFNETSGPLDVTNIATWSVTPGIAVVSGPGTIKALAPGNAIVTAKVGAFTTSITLVVTSRQPAS